MHNITVSFGMSWHDSFDTRPKSKSTNVSFFAIATVDFFFSNIKDFPLEMISCLDGALLFC